MNRTDELNELFSKLGKARGQLYSVLSERAIADPYIVAETQRIADETAHHHLQNDLIDRVRSNLEFMKKAPKMHAITKEAFVATAAVWLDVLSLPGSDLYQKFLSTPGGKEHVSILFEISKEDLTEEFGRAVIEEALKILENHGKNIQS